MAALQPVPLPDGRTVWAPNRLEALVLFQEIVRDRSYEKHGVALDQGATVFDVGANIGVFALHLCATVPGVRVRCFEPIPFLFEALERNLASHAPGATARSVGLGARAGEGTFTVNRDAAMTASMHPEVFDRGPGRHASIGEWAAAGLSDLERVESNPGIRLARAGLESPLTRALTLLALLPFGAYLLARRRLVTRRYRCPLDTLSAALRAGGDERVDLVKIDVEGAEEDVLDGVDDADWPRIRQLVIEVHDVEGRRDRMARRLTDAGYQVTHDREPWATHVLMGISTLYARRG